MLYFIEYDTYIMPYFNSIYSEISENVYLIKKKVIDMAKKERKRTTKCIKKE